MKNKECCVHCTAFEVGDKFNQETDECLDDIYCKKGHNDHIGWGQNACEDFEKDPIFK